MEVGDRVAVTGTVTRVPSEPDGLARVTLQVSDHGTVLTSVQKKLLVRPVADELSDVVRRLRARVIWLKRQSEDVSYSGLTRDEYGVRWRECRRLLTQLEEVLDG